MHKAEDLTSPTRAKVEFLSAAAAYAERPTAVEVKQTHMSWVFLAGTVVYKLKKPVKYPFLDFSTLEARELDCREEIRLNRRLAPDVYLGVVALTLDAAGRFALNGAGPTVDWLVEMRRLPERRMLDHAIVSGRLRRQDIDKVADVLAAFYRARPPADIAPRAFAAQIEHEHALNCAMLCDGSFDLPRAKVEFVTERFEKALTRETDRLVDRVRDGRVMEGHGDLRPEHVCLTEPPVVIDCLEFNHALRLVDPFDELAYLGMECRRLGATWVADALIERCTLALADDPGPRLIAFYTCYRACLRARLSLAHLLEPTPRNERTWLPQARAYLDLAERASVMLTAPGGPRSTHRGDNGE